MRELTIISEPHPRPEWREAVVRGVDNHNVAATELPDYYPVGFVIRGNRGEVLGGLLGDTIRRSAQNSNVCGLMEF